MLIARKVVFWVLPSNSVRKGSSLIHGDGLVKFSKENYPVLSVGDSYAFDVAPFAFESGETTFDSATVVVHSLEYHEADGGFFLLTCTTNPRAYAGLCLAHGETKL